jgi:hypothetical protein
MHMLNTTTAQDALDVGDVTGLVLYGLLLLLTVFAAVRHLWHNVTHESPQHTPTPGKLTGGRWTVAGAFYVLAVLFVSLRVGWFALVLANVDMFTQFTLNVLSDLLFFSCFSLIVIHWTEDNFKTTVGDSKHFHSTRIVLMFVVFNFALYTFQIVLLVIINLKVRAVYNLAFCFM